MRAHISSSFTRRACFRALSALGLPVFAESNHQTEFTAWVPMRWPWNDSASLQILDNAAVNCLLLCAPSRAFVESAHRRGLATLLLTSPDGSFPAACRAAKALNMEGVVLEGDIPDPASALRIAARQKLHLIRLPSRAQMLNTAASPAAGTFQGVWPGIRLLDGGAAAAGPSGTPWIATNGGFLRFLRLAQSDPVWIANMPPPQTVINTTGYLQALCDAAMVGATWVISLDPDYAERLRRREQDALNGWRRINSVCRYFAAHPEWRSMKLFGKFLLIQDPGKGGLLSGGILDMIEAQHTPVRIVSPPLFSAKLLEEVSMVLVTDLSALTDQQKDLLDHFKQSGGVVLLPPSGWTDHAPSADSFTLDRTEVDRINDIWRTVNTASTRSNLGVRLFNVASVLSNAIESPDGKQVVIHLVNYSDYPLENVAVHLLGAFKTATLMAPDLPASPLEIYKTGDGVGVDVESISVCATVQLQM